MIKVYSTKTCSHCKTAKEYFSSKNIDFESIDIGDDAIARQEMLDAGHRSVPIIDINGTIVSGWDKSKVESLLKDN